MSKGKEGAPAPGGPASGGTLVAAVLVAMSFLAGSYMVKSSLDRTGERLDAIADGLAETQQAIKAVAEAQPRPADNRRGPDPNRRYTISAASAPALGPSDARVKIFEFSDFQ